MIKYKNPWAVERNLDVQRTDLWFADLSFACKMVLNPSGIQINEEYERHARLVSAAFSSDAVCAITLPESVIDGVRMIDGTIQRSMPGYDQPLSAVRIEFWHEAYVESRPVSTSGIYSLLRCWQLLVTAGQTSSFSSSPLLLSCFVKPTFKCPLPITFKAGSEDGVDLDTTEKYSLNDVWLSQVQLPDLDAENTGLASIVATFNIGSIQNLI